MKRYFVRLTLLFAFILSILGPMQQPRAFAATTPTLIAEVNGAGKGRVWVGGVPAGSSTKPVLVFVHGLHGKAQNWWGATTYYGTNDMYAKAYAAGYRTAFVSLDDETGGPSSSISTNGATLSRQIDVILRHYGVSSVNIIAHSKGGLDSNSAAIHNGASTKIQKIVTLSSPHRGAELANLAYSWWAGWLANLLGQRDAGLASLQTSSVDYFRSITDSKAENSNVRFYTSGGTHHGPSLSSLWWGGDYLSLYGPNDGAVTVARSTHPRQYARLFTSSSLNHDNIRKGTNVWSLIEPTVRTNWRGPVTTGSNEVSNEQIEITSSSSSANTILRGGQLENQSATNTFPIESGVSNVSFDLLGSTDGMQVRFVSPDGRRYSPDSTFRNTDEVFTGATHYRLSLNEPTAGSWSVEISGPQDSAYLLVVGLSSSLRVSLTRDQSIVSPKGGFNLSINAPGATSTQLDAMLTGTPMKGEQHFSMPTQMKASATGSSDVAASMTAPDTRGIYQLGITVTGVDAKGMPFERSFATDLPVASTDDMKAAVELTPGR